MGVDLVLLNLLFWVLDWKFLVNFDQAELLECIHLGQFFKSVHNLFVNLVLLVRKVGQQVELKPQFFLLELVTIFVEEPYNVDLEEGSTELHMGPGHF